MVLGDKQALIQRLREALDLEVKWEEREVELPTPQSSAEIKNK